MNEQIVDKQLKKFITDIKHDLLLFIVADLREKKTTLGEAKYLAKDFLALMPAKNKGDVLDKLYSLTITYPEARFVFAKYIGPFEEEKTNKKLAILRFFMKKGEYEQAIIAVKGVH